MIFMPPPGGRPFDRGPRRGNPGVPRQGLVPAFLRDPVDHEQQDHPGYCHEIGDTVCGYDRHHDQQQGHESQCEDDRIRPPWHLVDKLLLGALPAAHGSEAQFRQQFAHPSEHDHEHDHGRAEFEHLLRKDHREYDAQQVSGAYGQYRRVRHLASRHFGEEPWRAPLQGQVVQVWRLNM